MSNGEIPNALKLFFYFLTFVLIIGIPTFKCHTITVDPNSPQVFSVKKTWWGLKEKEIEIIWMKAPGYDYEAWCAKGKDGGWYPYIIE